MVEVRVFESVHNGWYWEDSDNLKGGFETSQDAFDDWHWVKFES
jgi:hypothetical protein